MAEITIHPYEVLVRLNQDGTVRGAHRVRLRIITEGAETIAAQTLDAEPLALSPELQEAISLAEAAVGG